MTIYRLAIHRVPLGVQEGSFIDFHIALYETSPILKWSLTSRTPTLTLIYQSLVTTLSRQDSS